MSISYVLFLAFAIGIVSGMRSLTAPAVAAWAAHRNWLNLASCRTKPVGLIARIVCGALSGAAVSVSAGQSLGFGALLGAAGGIAGAYAGYQWRTGLVKALGVPDFVIALLEDAIAIGGGLFLVSRF